MEVHLIGYSCPMNLSKPTEVFVAACAKGCYSEESSYDILDHLTLDNAQKTLRHIVGSGHGSVVEHLVFTFSVEGISRACANQLVRHRLASYSQQSQRYVKFKDVDMIVPKSVFQNDTGNKTIDDARKEIVVGLIDNYMNNLDSLVDYLRENGVPDEDIRYFYPIGMKTNITVTMNARSLLNFFTWRCCGQAQWEIRELAERMLKICKDIAPTVFENAGPECKRTGCHEGKRSCKLNVKVKE